jgi:transcriptional regulator with XRE-family HTH domain
MRTAREKKGYHQKELAKMVGLRQPQISRLERFGMPSARKVAKIAEVLGNGLTLENICFPRGLRKKRKGAA